MQENTSDLELEMQELEAMDAPGFLTSMAHGAGIASAIAASAVAGYT